MHFFFLLWFVKMYCIFYVLLVRKINFCFGLVFLLQMSFAAVLEVGRDRPGHGEEEEAMGAYHPTAVSLPIRPGCALLDFGAP